ncbi:MAG: hypothetical protein ACD_22C00176G0005 [uncultured bacterium]|nr:MAG: hypothetical protein ACD_22C00176G0005 [uncultured bacterium]
MTAQKDPSFKDIINKADLSLPDGAGILFADYFIKAGKNIKKDALYPLKVFLLGLWVGLGTALKKIKLGERISGVDLVYALCSYAQKEGKTIFLLGGWQKTKLGKKLPHHGYLAEKAAKKLKLLYPDLKIVGYTSDFSYKESDDIRTQDYLHSCMNEHSIASIDILLVAYGAPMQEKFIVRNMDKIPARLCIGLGGTFDYIAEYLKRSPKFFINHNLEWFYKIFMQPGRLARVFTAFPLFPLRVFLDTLKVGSRN